LNIKNLSIILLSVTLCIFCSAESAHSRQYRSQQEAFQYPRQVEGAMRAIKRLPEGQQLINQITQEGPIRIEVASNHSSGFGAMWEGGRRVISINGSHARSKGSYICSILFEMHNAATNKLLYSLVRQAMRGEITKDEYVLRVERMEHQNAVNTCMLLEKGIKMGIFPTSCEWAIHRNFEDHYKVQQLLGHSQWIANSYEGLNPQGKRMRYHGTIPNLTRLSQRDKQDMLRYLSIKDSLNSPSSQRVAQAKQLLLRERRQVSAHQAQLLHAVFEGDPVFESLVINATETYSLTD